MLTLKSPAKINFVLEVLKRDASGYHQISTIFHELGLHDILTFSESASFALVCDDKNIPLDQNNLVFKAYDLLKTRFRIKNGLKVTLEKNIPIGSGLGGGSSNAATTLKALNKLWELKLSTHDLMLLGAKIGMDVNFFIDGGTALGTHYGEKVISIPHRLALHILVLAPAIRIDTKEAYLSLGISESGSTKHTEPCLKALKEGDWELLINAMHNDFEKVVFGKHPEIKQLRDDLVAQGARKALLTGSGSGVFGLFKDQKMLKKAAEHFRSRGVFLWHQSS